MPGLIEDTGFGVLVGRGYSSSLNRMQGYLTCPW